MEAEVAAAAVAAVAVEAEAVEAEAVEAAVAAVAAAAVEAAAARREASQLGGVPLRELGELELECLVEAEEEWCAPQPCPSPSIAAIPTRRQPLAPNPHPTLTLP